jgi:hypothetical protein
VLADGRADPDPVVLGECEGLEVVENDRLVEITDLPDRLGLQQQTAAAQPGRQPRHRRRGTAHGASDLAVGATGDQARGDGP